MNVNELAVIVADAGGYDEAAELLEIDVDLIEKAIAGGRLNRLEVADIDEGISRAFRGAPDIDNLVAPLNISCV